ncbi:MAG TPA: four helix bundle protein [Candidatus Bathyarchaeia archaeon]|nr:four helix bundle protein [Candidatus Bathyarchaeia archaeon]
MGIYKCEDLDVYRLSFESAMDIFDASKRFPIEERYSLTDQVRRSSRSIAANIREGFAKKRYKDVFLRHLNDALGSAEETITWLDFSYRCCYLEQERYHELEKVYKRIGGMVYGLARNWK